MLRVICERASSHKPGSCGGLGQKRLDSDLEAILLKALRKEPLERYLEPPSSSPPMLRAYLDGKPVGARHGTIRYRAAKFVRRHTAGSLPARHCWPLPWLRAWPVWCGRPGWPMQERRKAEARSADLRQLSNSLLSELDEAIKQLPGSTGVQKAAW
jgi:hypothetical protein